MPVFWEAWKIINDNFYAMPIDQDKMTYGAVGGMVDALGDEHTAFVDAKRAAYYEELKRKYENAIARPWDAVPPDPPPPP